MNNIIKLIIEKYQDIPDFAGIKIASITSRGISNDQLLHVAVINGDKTSVESLLAEGAPINEKGENGFTPLHYAVEHGHYDLVALLIACGADKNIKNEFNEKAIDVADNLGEVEIKEYLVKEIEKK